VNQVLNAASRCASDFSDLCVEIENRGTDTLTSALVELTYDGGGQTVNYMGNLAFGEKDTVCFLAPQSDSGVYDFSFILNLAGDANPGDDTFNQSIEYFDTPDMPTLFGNTSIDQYGDSTILYATTIMGQVHRWYDATTGGDLLFVGDTFHTGAVNADTTYYVEATAGGTQSLGPADTTIGGGELYTFFPDGLNFEATTVFKLNSVRVYPFADTGTIVVNVTNGITTHSKSFVDVGMQAGGVVLNLDFFIGAGTTWQINAAGSNVPMFRNSSGAVYPYISPDETVTITGAINGLPDYYYFFYDWKIASGCPSERTPISVGLGCQPVTTLSGVSTDGDLQESSGYITSTQTIVSGHTVDYTAADSILLQPDFEVELGAIFTAIISDCSASLDDGHTSLTASDKESRQVGVITQKELDKLSFIKKQHPDLYQELRHLIIDEGYTVEQLKASGSKYEKLLESYSRLE
jgi:hypothetical protein